MLIIYIYIYIYKRKNIVAEVGEYGRQVNDLPIYNEIENNTKRQLLA